MGIAIDQHLNRLAVATRDTIWIAHNEISVARQLSVPGSVGTCFLTRSAHASGDIQAHQIAWGHKELWMVNTRFSCPCTPDEKHRPGGWNRSSNSNPVSARSSMSL